MRVVFCSSALLALHARAESQALCAPQAIGVPGNGGPPNWTGSDSASFKTLINDPRWNGAARIDLPSLNGTDTSGPGQIGLRALHDTDSLYLSFKVRSDANNATKIKNLTPPMGGTTQVADTIIFGLKSANPAHAPKLFILPLNTEMNGAAQGSPAIQPLVSTWNSATMTWGEPMPPVGDFLNTALWVGPAAADGDRWGMNVRLNTGAMGLGFTAPYQFFAAVWLIVFYDATTIHDRLIGWPSVNMFSDVNINDLSTLHTLISEPNATWAPLSLGTFASPCTGGVSLNYMQIFTDNTPNSKVVTAAGASNTFRVEPDWGLFSRTPGLIQAQFRLAKWGAQIGVGSSWTEVLGFSKTVNDPADASRKDNTNSGTGNIEIVCTNGNMTRPCPTLTASQSKHQCMYVQLSATTGNSVTFSSDSAYRNMDFETSSLLAREATISVQGLAPLAGQDRRDVYISVETANMPAELKEPMELPREQMAEARSPGAAAVDAGTDAGSFDAGSFDAGRQDNDAGAGEPDREPVPHQTESERVASIWPTYQVHAYHELKRWQDPNGITHVRLEDSVPFGYFVDHEGELWGWDHAITGVNGAELEQIAPDYYHVKIPNDGAIDVMTYVLAKEEKDQTVENSCDDPRCPKPPGGYENDAGTGNGSTHKVSCSCQLLGSSSTSPVGLSALVTLLLGICWKLRRRARTH